MQISDQINQRVQKLPRSLQVEVLNFVEFLVLKVEQKRFQQDLDEWADFSLGSAMRDMENESPLYTLTDLKEGF
jgi:hypothetical protein